MSEPPTSHGRGSRWVSEQLVSVCTGASLGSPASSDVADELVAAARYHRIAPVTHVRYRSVDPELSARLRPERDQAVGIHLRATMMLAELGLILGDVPWVTFKGPVLSETAHPLPGLRSYHDIDVLVSPSDLREVCGLLGRAGWGVADYDDMLRNPETPGEMHWITPSGLAVDLHWSMTNTAVRRARLSVPTDEVLARRHELAIGFGKVWALDPVDALVHVCLHAALTGANRLLFLLDADLLARQVDDWPLVAQRAREWRAQHHVALVLHRAAGVLGTSVPDDLDTQLGVSGAFGLMCTVVDARAPVPSARREPGLARLVARAVRPGAARTALSVARSAALGAVERASGTKDRKPSERTTGDSEALELYLAAVESAGRT